MNIPEANELVSDNVGTGLATSERWLLNTSANSGIALYSGSMGLNTGTFAYNTTWSDDYADNNTYATRKPSAIRVPKKKRGDITDANSPKKRLKLLQPVAVFHFVKKRFNILEQRKLSSRFERICQLMETAKVCNQVALKDKLNDKFGRFIREQEMITCGFKQYIEKEDLQRFIDLCAKPSVIKLTKIKNYIRIIPKCARQRLEKAKKAQLFDEFVVLHTDPDNKAIEKTREEKKDPILFGVITESSRYYVVGDWTDEYCDITMDKIINALDFEKEDTILDQDVEKALFETLLAEESK